MNVKLLSPLILIALTFMMSAPAAFAAKYEIVLRNRTPQTLTSPVCAAHRKSVSIFTTGEAASDGLVELAEDGVSGIFADELRETAGVRTVKVGNFTSRNSSQRITISTRPRRTRLSCVLGMLVSTNDGFPAFRNRRLPRNVGDRVRFRARAYDAGSEVNTESCDHVPGAPCDAHFIGEDENGTIQHHPGILGIADLDPDTRGWQEPAVRGFIRRIE